jgi:hypothetical protein
MKIKKWLVFVLNAVGVTPASGINSVLFIIVLYTYSVPLHESAKEHTSKPNCLLSADGSHHQSQVITHSDSVNERVK